MITLEQISQRATELVGQPVSARLELPNLVLTWTDNERRVSLMRYALDGDIESFSIRYLVPLVQ